MKLVRVASNRHLRNWETPDALVQEIIAVTSRLGGGQRCAVATPKIPVSVQRFSIHIYRCKSKGLEIHRKAVCEECSRSDYFIPNHLPSFIRHPPRDIGMPVFFDTRLLALVTPSARFHENESEEEKNDFVDDVNEITQILWEPMNIVVTKIEDNERCTVSIKLTDPIKFLEGIAE